MFLALRADWPLLALEEEVRLMATYHSEPPSPGAHRRGHGAHRRGGAGGYPQGGLRSLGLGESWSRPLHGGRCPRGVRMDYQRVYEGQGPGPAWSSPTPCPWSPWPKRHASKWPACPWRISSRKGSALASSQAIDRSDLSLKTKLSTYATWWIRDALGKAVKRHRLRPPHRGAEGRGSWPRCFPSMRRWGTMATAMRTPSLLPEREEPPGPRRRRCRRG